MAYVQTYIKFDYLHKNYSKAFNEIISGFNIGLDTDEIEVLNDCRTIEQAVEVFNESLMDKYTVTYHDDIEKLIKFDIRAKYKCIKEDSPILDYIDIDSYFDNEFKDKQENTFIRGGTWGMCFEIKIN